MSTFVISDSVNCFGSPKPWRAVAPPSQFPQNLPVIADPANPPKFEALLDVKPDGGNRIPR